MKEEILTSVRVFTGHINMPEGFEINKNEIGKEILSSSILKTSFPFMREIDKIDTYLREYIYLDYKIWLVQKNINGLVFLPNDHSDNQLEIDKMDLKNSCDYVMFYGVHINDDSFKIKIEFDDNRRKTNYKEIILHNNDFVIFPSSQRYSILENTSNSPNIALIGTYEYM
jgi:hypothetical protein